MSLDIFITTIQTSQGVTSLTMVRWCWAQL